jgi:predicted aldo/keto reductase-like oxidoreductase
MEKRFFANIGKEISLLGFGLMRLPLVNPEGSDVDYPTAERMIARAIEGGINYFDTGWFYLEGNSERFAGDALSKIPRKSYYLATKMPSWMVQSPEEAESLFAEQLNRCKTDHFDFYLCHNLGGGVYDHARKHRVIEFLNRKKREGVIGHLGFSLHDGVERLRLLLDEHEWDFAQIQLNYIDWESQDAKGLYELLADRGIPVIVMEPVRGGVLANLPADAANILKKADEKASQASWAIRYAASLPGVMTVLSGMSAPSQLEDNLNTMNNFQPLSDVEHMTLKQTATAYRSSGVVPCSGCRYCMDCPSGVDIPRMFAAYNHSRNMPADKPGLVEWIFRCGYLSLNERERAHRCTDCGRCLELCPQKIDIPKRMKEIAGFASEILKY